MTSGNCEYKCGKPLQKRTHTQEVFGVEGTITGKEYKNKSNLANRGKFLLPSDAKYTKETRPFSTLNYVFLVSSSLSSQVRVSGTAPS